jgi:transcriptional regulator with XRE-family HTH domain
VPGSLFDKRRKSFATRVRALRVERCLSQEALAYEVGTDRAYQSQIKRGVGNPSRCVLCAIAVALKVDLAELLTL